MTAPFITAAALVALQATIPIEDHVWINPFGRLDKPDDLTGLSSSEITQKMHEYLAVPKGITYCIVVERDDKLLMFKRFSCPCYGDLAKYSDWEEHGKFGKMNPYHPPDLYFPFPSGRPVSVGMASTVSQDDNPLFRALLTDSCYSEVCKGVDLCFEKRFLKSLVFTDMDIDPTLWWNFLVHLRGGHFKSTHSAAPFFDKMKALDLSDREAVDLSLLFGQGNLVGPGYLAYSEPQRVIQNNPKRISGGTFAKGYGYTRPKNEYIFGDCGARSQLPYEKLGFKKNPYGSWAGQVTTIEQVRALQEWCQAEIERVTKK